MIMMCFDLPHATYAHIESSYVKEKSLEELKRLGYEKMK